MFSNLFVIENFLDIPGMFIDVTMARFGGLHSCMGNSLVSITTSVKHLKLD
jgi:hypothetical protein